MAQTDPHVAVIGVERMSRSTERARGGMMCEGTPGFAECTSQRRYLPHLPGIDGNRIYTLFQLTKQHSNTARVRLSSGRARRCTQWHQVARVHARWIQTTFPISSSLAFRLMRSSVDDGSEVNNSILFRNVVAASLNAWRFTLSLPSTAAGSATRQCADMG